MRRLPLAARALPILLLPLIIAVASAQPARERAEEHARNAIAAMDAGDVERALVLLDSAIRLDPKEPTYRYEKGYALMLKGDHAGGLKIVEPLLKDTSATDLFYQLAATMHVARRDTAAAGRVLRQGLARNPGWGRLHYELGAIEESAGRYPEAVAHYERGMRAQPSYGENYYRAALIMAASSEPIWGLVYGEMFMNIERQSERTARMGQLLVETYRRTISAGGDSAFAVRFSESTGAEQVSGIGDPDAMLAAMSRPEWLYEFTAMQALAVSDHCRKEGITLRCLDQFRTEYTRRWFDQKLDEKAPSRLFDWHRLLLELGYLDEYNYWLLGAANPDEFYAFVEERPTDFDHFQKWFRVNGMSLR